MDFLKLLGVDPSSIQKQVNEAGEKMTAVIRHFDERINGIEAKLDILLNDKAILEDDVIVHDPE